MRYRPLWFHKGTCPVLAQDRCWSARNFEYFENSEEPKGYISGGVDRECEPQAIAPRRGHRRAAVPEKAPSRTPNVGSYCRVFFATRHFAEANFLLHAPNPLPSSLR